MAEVFPVYGWIGGDRPSDVLEQAKARKAQGFTAVKMNAVESVSSYQSSNYIRLQGDHSSLGWTRRMRLKLRYNAALM